jgi:hypothetical protein
LQPSRPPDPRVEIDPFYLAHLDFEGFDFAAFDRL